MDRKKQIEIVNSWLMDISESIGMDFKLDSEGICSFKIGEDAIVMEVSYEYPMVHLYSPLLALTQDNQGMQTALFARALELNAFQMITRGGTIAMAPGGGFLIYCYSIPIEGVNSELFSSYVGEFYDTLPELKQLLSQFNASNLKNELPKSDHFNLFKKV